jgi:hypothetical protein
VTQRAARWKYVRFIIVSIAMLVILIGAMLVVVILAGILLILIVGILALLALGLAVAIVVLAALRMSRHLGVAIRVRRRTCCGTVNTDLAAGAVGIG